MHLVASLEVVARIRRTGCRYTCSLRDSSSDHATAQLFPCVLAAMEFAPVGLEALAWEGPARRPTTDNGRE